MPSGPVFLFSNAKGGENLIYDIVSRCRSGNRVDRMQCAIEIEHQQFVRYTGLGRATSAASARRNPRKGDEAKGSRMTEVIILDARYDPVGKQEFKSRSAKSFRGNLRPGLLRPCSP